MTAAAGPAPCWSQAPEAASAIALAQARLLAPVEVLDPDLPQLLKQAAQVHESQSARRKYLAGVLTLLIVAGVFGFALPRIASYGGVWASLTAMSWPSILLIGASAVVSQVAGWMMIGAVLPSLRLRDAAAVNLGSSAVANTLPGGGAVAMGVSWAMLSSWGVGTAEYIRYTLVSGFWNVFARFAGLIGRVVSRVLAAGCALARRKPPQRVPGMLLDFRAGHRDCWPSAGSASR